MVEETEKWLEDKLAEQKKAALTEEPVFLAAELMRKVRKFGSFSPMSCSYVSSRGRDCVVVAMATY